MKHKFAFNKLIIDDFEPIFSEHTCIYCNKDVMDIMMSENISFPKYYAYGVYYDDYHKITTDFINTKQKRN